MVEIQVAADDRQLNHVKQLFFEYAESMEYRLCFEGFKQEVAELAVQYGAPKGKLLLAFVDEEPVGCVGLRSIDEYLCEMRRLYVKPEFRGQGIGRRLAQSVLNEARNLGYRVMRLETLFEMKDAIALYQSLEFVETSRDESDGSLVMELVLS